MNDGQRQKRTARQAAVKIVAVLQEADHVAYLAGGCVRDELLGMNPKDYDVATDALPGRVAELFRNTQFVGEAFGVVLVRLMGFAIEVATFRSEWDYEDGRRPTTVSFSDARHDAFRRDFTINGLFEDPLATDPAERVIDFVGGQDDLRAGVVRAIGEPSERFDEDYLRMLRAVRFASRLAFRIDAGTAAAIREHAPLLEKISRERIGQEVQAMLSEPRRGSVSRLLRDLKLDAPVLMEPPKDDTVDLVAALRPDANYATVLAAWMLQRHALSESVADQDGLRHCVDAFVQTQLERTTERWRKALCLSNEHRDAVRRTVATLPRLLRWDTLNVAQRKRLLADPVCSQAMQLLMALGALGEADALLARIEAQSVPLLAEGVAPLPLITGDDLIALGFSPGPRFKAMLDAVYDAQLVGQVASQQQAIDLARKFGAQEP